MSWPPFFFYGLYFYAPAGQLQHPVRFTAVLCCLYLCLM